MVQSASFEDLGQALAYGGAGRDRCGGRWQLPTGGLRGVAKDPTEDAGGCVPWFFVDLLMMSIYRTI